MEQPIQNNEEPIQVEATQPTITLGTMLREARERLGLSIGDVANQIKFAPRQLEALEADDFTMLSEAAFLKGFVRSYGKLLHLDLDTLFAALPAAKVAMLTATPAPYERNFPNALTARRQNYVWLGAALVFVVVALGFAIANYDSPAQSSNDATAETAVTLPTDMATIAELPAEPIAAASAVEQVVVVNAVSAVAASLLNVEVPAPAQQAIVKPVMLPPIKIARPNSVTKTPIVPDTKPAAVEATTERETIPIDLLLGTQSAKPAAVANEASSNSSLRIVFGEESWAEIKDKNGKSLTSKVNARGSELRLEGSPPFTLSIAHAKSARLYYKGKQVDLKPYIKKLSTTEVANVTLE